MSILRYIGIFQEELLKYRPSIIFHAAAYKHVPLMETNLVEAIVNNILATKILAEAAILCGTKRFVLISTDKAIEPTSVMGVSKAFAEKMIQVFRSDIGTRFITVRFGNVIDSSGSVVPIFRQQIAHGGPVTVTHPEMTRYFMTIPEAIQLVILAGAWGQGGEIFVLDMGEPVSIPELARSMTKLSGFEPDKDIPIKFTGIRPGEKLHEKLFWDYEEALPTQHERLMMVKNSRVDTSRFKEDLQRLEEAASSVDLPVPAHPVMKTLLPEYFIVSRARLNCSFSSIDGCLCLGLNIYHRAMLASFMLKIRLLLRQVTTPLCGRQGSTNTRSAKVEFLY